MRIVWEFFADDEDEERRLFLPGKNSNARDRGRLTFRFVDSAVPMSDEGDFVGRLEWESGAVAMSADEAARRQRDGEGGDSFPVEWLRDVIGDGAVAATEATAQARKAGLSGKQLRNALRIKPYESDFEGGWCWQLPTE